MKYLTYVFLIGLFHLTGCQTPNGQSGRIEETQEMSPEEMARVSNLLITSPSTYQEGQINELIKVALNRDWPVHQTKSGLLYWISEPGNDRKPKDNSQIQVWYRGQLKDGTVFDESPARRGFSTFYLNQMITAWREALPMIGEGGKMVILLHSDLGYGGRQISSKIPPYSPLIFELELIHVSPDEAL